MKMSLKSTKHLITRSILILKSCDYLCKLTQTVRKICMFVSLKKKNLLTAAKAPLCQGATPYYSLINEP